MSDVNSTQQHNAREYEEGSAPDNLGHDLWGCADKTSHEVINEEESISSAIENQFKEREVKTKSNSIVALEYVLSASPSWWKKAQEQGKDLEALLDSMKEFVSERHGKHNLISVSPHLDESTPHIHVVITPIEKKILKYRNKKGDCHKEKNVLSARNYTNKKHQYRALQDDWTDFFNSRVASHFKDVDMSVKRGTKVIEQERQYIKSTSHEIGHLRAELAKLQSLQVSILKGWNKLKENEKKRAEKDMDRSMVKSEVLKEEIESKTNSIEQSEKKIINQKKLYKKGKNDNWKKGHSY